MENNYHASIGKEVLYMADEPRQGNPNADQNLTDEDRAKGGSMSGGNFKNDPQRASEAGRKGGQASQPNDEEEEEE
jgi:general stress protein YciG